MSLGDKQSGVLGATWCDKRRKQLGVALQVWQDMQCMAARLWRR